MSDWRLAAALPETNSLSLKNRPTQEEISSYNFQGQAVSFGECIFVSFWLSFFLAVVFLLFMEGIVHKLILKTSYLRVS